MAPPARPAPEPGPAPGGSACFRVKPYLQMGDTPGEFDRMALLWHAQADLAGWEVDVRADPAAGWVRMPPATSWLVAVARRPHHPSRRPHRVWAARLGPLAPGAPFSYRVLRDGLEVFQGTGMARKAPGQRQRVAVVGDLAEGTPPSRAIACQILAQQPDLMVAVGDLVYERGTIREYRTRFFPTYNADRADPAAGAPFMRGRLMVGVLGNHDVDHVGRGRVPPRDSLAYYYYWDQPLNGPDPLPGGHVPRLEPAADWAGFRTGAGDRFPRMGNFSFRSGDVHWTILDSNRYMHWQDPGLRAWLEAELTAAQSARWRFVAFHHPAFNLSSFHHTGDWHMRELWPLFQRFHVDLVFCGHLHTYQRTTPLVFTPVPPGSSAASHCADERNIVPDTAFDGRTVTRANGPIQILTGAGGGFVHPTPLPRTRKPFFGQVVVNTHCFSLLDIDGDRIEFRQLDDRGAVVDAFTLTR